MLFISMDHRPAIVSPASKAVRPNTESWFGAPIQRTTTVVGGGGGGCVHVLISYKSDTLMISPKRIPV